ncbi:MAG: UDP-3-O-(3-hydroxymyristoyl)glucosamine N-acyltransferase [Candidatus Eisenbacteria bacterium]|nr:UDP-3-O-(3-hydroxymyristoyl)glucosamine N-acyltransferase [Candidatus Eisenbacteria bacterium]
MKLQEIADRVGGEIVGDPDIEITGVAGIREARPGDITFFANPRYEAHLRSTDASAIILSKNGVEAGAGKTLLISPNPYVAFLRVIELFAPRDYEKPCGIHPTAVIGKNVTIGASVTIGPHAVIEDDAAIGEGTRILPNTYVGFRARIGRDCLIYPNVTIREDSEIGDRVILHSGSVIGSDGFGFTKNGPRHMKIPQIGRVVIGDDVEIGANTTIDRATVGTTRIGKGTKIDNLVQIAHNAVVGENTIIVAQVGISGSTEIGDNVTLAGQAGIVGHIRIGDNVKVGAQAGVTKSVPSNTAVSGYPAREHSLSRKIYASITRLPDLIRRLATLERRVNVLEGKPAGDPPLENGEEGDEE